MTAWIPPATWANGTLTAAFTNAEVRDHFLWLKAWADLITNSSAADTGTTTFLSITRTSASDGILRGLVSGDAQYRLLVRADGRIGWASGAATEDVVLQRTASGPGFLEVDALGVAAGGTFRVRTREGGMREAIQVFVSDGASPGTRIALGVHATNSDPMLYMARSSGNVIRMYAEADGRWVMKADTGHSKIGVVHGDNSTENNAFFAWVSGDSQPRVALGQDSSGRARIAFGGGGAGAVDAVFFREGAGVLTSLNTAIRLARDATTSGAVAIRTTGDSTDRILMYAGGMIDIGEIATPAVPAADFARLYVQDNGSGKTRLVVKFNTGADVVLATQA